MLTRLLFWVLWTIPIVIFSQEQNPYYYENIAIKYLNDSIIKKNSIFKDYCINSSLNLTSTTSYYDISSVLYINKEEYLKSKITLDSLRNAEKTDTTMSYIKTLIDVENGCVKNQNTNSLFFKFISKQRKFNEKYYVSLETQTSRAGCSYTVTIEMDSKGKVTNWIYRKECL